MRAAGGRAARAADVACRGAPLQPIARSQITRVAVGSCLDQAACRTVVSTAIRCSCNLPTPTWHAQDDRGYGLPSAAPSRRSMAVFCRTPAPILGLCVPLRPPKRQRSIPTKEYNFFSTFSTVRGSYTPKQPPTSARLVGGQFVPVQNLLRLTSSQGVSAIVRAYACSYA